MNAKVNLSDSEVERLYGEYKAAKEKLLSALLHEEVVVTQKKTVSNN